MYFGQLSEYLGGLKSYVLSDRGSGKAYDFKEHQLIEHNDADKYFVQYVNALDQITEDYVIYCQEDFFLYANVNHDMLQKARDFLESSNYDYVRLIRCGYQTPLKEHVKDNFFEVDMATQDAFSMQATMWKKSRMRMLYTHVGSEKWLEAEHWNVGARQVGIKGTFMWNGEPQIGAFHYDSRVWPYVCTGINRGKWNMDQYPEIMKELVVKYNVNVNVRGVRVR